MITSYFYNLITKLTVVGEDGGLGESVALLVAVETKLEPENATRQSQALMDKVVMDQVSRPELVTQIVVVQIFGSQKSARNRRKTAKRVK